MRCLYRRLTSHLSRRAVLIQLESISSLAGISRIYVAHATSLFSYSKCIIKCTHPRETEGKIRTYQELTARIRSQHAF